MENKSSSANEFYLLAVSLGNWHYLKICWNSETQMSETSHFKTSTQKYLQLICSKTLLCSLIVTLLVSFHFQIFFLSNCKLSLVCIVWGRIFVRNRNAFYCPSLVVIVLLLYFCTYDFFHFIFYFCQYFFSSLVVALDFSVSYHLLLTTCSHPIICSIWKMEIDKAKLWNRHQAVLS